MSSTVNVSFTLKKQNVLVAPAAGSNMRVHLMQDGVAVGGVMVFLPALIGQPVNVPDGTYTVEVQRLSVDGTPIGAPSVSARFDVEAMSEIDVPDVVTVTF